MIYMLTKLKCADNSGAKTLKCVKVLGGSMRTMASVGDVIVVSVTNAVPNGKIKKGSVHKAVVVRTTKEYHRPDGSTIKYDENSAVLINKDGEPQGTRIFGSVPRELRARGYMKIISLAPEVL